MSYISEEQLLRPPIEKCLDANEELMTSISERLKAVETWSAAHLQECLELKRRLEKLNLDLRMIAQKTR